MLRAFWFVVVAVMIAMGCQSFVVNVRAEQPEDNVQQILKLEVVPHLVANNKIRVEYRLDYSSLRENSGSEQSGFPKIGHTMVETTFEASPGETFVSGGLQSKVHAGDQSEHFEVVLLVTPELVGR